MAAVDVHSTHPAGCAACARFLANRACLSHTCPDCGSIVHAEVNAAGELTHRCPTPDVPTSRITIVQLDHDAAGTRFPIDVPTDLLRGLDPEVIAEVVYCAVDEPQYLVDHGTELEQAIAAAVRPRRELAQLGDMRGFMVGDVVEFGDTALMCDSVGWVDAPRP